MPEIAKSHERPVPMLLKDRKPAFDSKAFSLLNEQFIGMTADDAAKAIIGMDLDSELDLDWTFRSLYENRIREGSTKERAQTLANADIKRLLEEWMEWLESRFFRFNSVCSKIAIKSEDEGRESIGLLIDRVERRVMGLHLHLKIASIQKWAVPEDEEATLSEVENQTSEQVSKVLA